MSKKFDKKLKEIEDWLDHYSDDLDEDGYSVVFHATKLRPDTAEEWYSYTGFPVGLVDSLATLSLMIGDYIGYENVTQFLNELTKYASIKENVWSGKTNPTLIQPQHDAVCKAIMDTYSNSVAETLAKYKTDTLVDEVLENYLDNDESVETEN